MEKKDGQYQIIWQEGTLDEGEPTGKRNAVKISDPEDGIVYLRATVSYSTSRTQFYYSLDNKTYRKLGRETSLGFNLSVFVGARFGLFCYSTQICRLRLVLHGRDFRRSDVLS